MSARSIWLARAVFTLLAAAAVAGCGSNCASNCPNIEFDVFATVGENLNVQTATWTGAGCPIGVTPQCRGDFGGTNLCVRYTILASQPGTCELDLTFSDGRFPFSATATFGEETHQGCCHGFPVTGPATVTVPPLHPVIEFDSGTDAGTADAGTPDAGTADAAPDLASDT